MGPSMSLHVMPGDNVEMMVYAKYTQEATSTDPITGMATIVAASAGAGAVAELSQMDKKYRNFKYVTRIEVDSLICRSTSGQVIR